MLSVFSSLYAGNLMYYSSMLKAEKVIVLIYLKNLINNLLETDVYIASPNGI